MTPPRFAVLMPIKDGREAKTRLGAVGAHGRADLMAAFARDALSAAAAVPGVAVYVVGDADGLGAEARLAAGVLPDEGAGDLNRALAHAASALGGGVGVAALLADLPCLRVEDLTVALRAAEEHGGRCYVADADGTGTTLLTAAPGVALSPRFGRGSAAAHALSGATALDDQLTSLRLDVDTTADLARALSFGVGEHTARAAAALA